MYTWRDIPPDERVILLEERQQQKYPWHRPPTSGNGCWLHISAACYEHRSLIGKEPHRMSSFAQSLLTSLQASSLELSAWCLLPNHYHGLIRVADPAFVRREVGKLHGRTSHAWNVEENKQGRTCFHSCLCKQVKSLSHRWATLNYIHHNPVKHGYVERWQDWPYSSAHEYLKNVGSEKARQLWREFPILDMGAGWDE
jgi:putative transposase